MRFPEETYTAPVPVRATRRTSRFRVYTSTSRTERCCRSGGSVFRGLGVGSWERVGQHQCVAHFKFSSSTPHFIRRGSEEVTSHIRLTGPDTFEATATWDLFDAARVLTAQGCLINGTATRFE